MSRALWWLLACSRTATAVLMTTATRAATTNDWGAVPELLKRREVSAVFVEDAASLIDGSGWATALEGAAEVVVECDCCVEDVASTLAEAFWPDDASYASKAAPGFVQLARRFDECLGAASDGGRVRVRATVAVGGRATQPCPRLHTDDVVLRGWWCWRARRRSSRPARASTWTTCCPRGRSKAAPDGDEISPPPGAACLLKGRRWPGLFAPAAAHRSPAPTEGRRVLLALDRLCDVTWLCVLLKQCA